MFGLFKPKTKIWSCFTKVNGKEQFEHWMCNWIGNLWTCLDMKRKRALNLQLLKLWTCFDMGWSFRFEILFFGDICISRCSNRKSLLPFISKSFVWQICYSIVKNFTFMFFKSSFDISTTLTSGYFMIFLYI